jgi:hypothetical protein
MVQAARSGVQNIAEGSQAAGTSKKTELKLTYVARASLEERASTTKTFCASAALALWDRNDPRHADLIARRSRTADEVSGCAHAMNYMDGGNKVDKVDNFEKFTESTKSTTSIKSSFPELAVLGDFN